MAFTVIIRTTIMRARNVRITKFATVVCTKNHLNGENGVIGRNVQRPAVEAQERETGKQSEFQNY